MSKHDTQLIETIRLWFDKIPIGGTTSIYAVASLCGGIASVTEFVSALGVLLENNDISIFYRIIHNGVTLPDEYSTISETPDLVGSMVIPFYRRIK